MKHLGLLLIVISLLAASCDKGENAKLALNGESENDAFLITANQVGELTRGTTVRQLYQLFPSRQIKHTQTSGGFFDQVIDNYDIYSSEGRLLLTVSPTTANDTSAMINQIIVRDTLYKTAQGIGLNATLKDIREKYHNLRYIPTANQIVVSVPRTGINFLIDQHALEDNWWNDLTKEVENQNIPDSTRLEGVVIYWRGAEAPPQGAAALFTAQFWQDILAKFVNWCVVELPSIAILIALFVGLLRFARFSVGKMKKMALNKAQKSDSVDTDEASKRINTLSGITYGIVPLGRLPAHPPLQIQH